MQYKNVLYKNILQVDVDEKDQGHQHWMQRLNTDMDRDGVLNYFRSVAQKENMENTKTDFQDLFLDTGNQKALMVCRGDLSTTFATTALLESFHETYPDTDLYFASPPETHHILDGNPHITKLLPYHEKMEDEFAMVGRLKHEGFVDYYINVGNPAPKNTTSKNAFAV